MTIKEQINADLKQAMLGGDKTLATTLRGIKSAILNVEIAESKRDKGLSDNEVTAILSKEAKKRQESAELYRKGSNDERADAELTEKKIIETYLPEQIADDKLEALVNETIAETKASGMKDMGKVISAVKDRVGSQAEGSRIAAVVKEKLS